MMFTWNEWLTFIVFIPLAQWVASRFFVHDPKRVALVRSWAVALTCCSLGAVVAFAPDRIVPALVVVVGAFAASLVARLLVSPRP